MSGNENAKRMKSLPVLCRWALAIVPLALAVSCGEAAPSFVIPPGGSGGTAGSSGTGGMAGNAGTGGTAGIGGMAGSGGAAGTGGNAGTGGAGGSSGVCATSALCHSCPSEALPDTLLCDTDDDCAFPPGHLCVPSGCETHAGAPIGQCQPAAGGSCVGDDDNDDCPNAGDYDCTTVGAGGKRCVRVSSGCTTATEGYDCAPGFSCEGGECVDRRVPCDDPTDCPKSHICHTGIPTGSFCVRVYRTCHVKDDCRWAGVLLGAGCVDVDNHGRDECTGDLDTPLNPCVNAMCSGSTPVCENGVFGTGSKAVCGDYGLCRTDDDCGGAFVCADLFQNGRKECVPSPGVPSPDDCESATDCPPQQVCAAPRDGGSPSCQAGKEAM